MSTVNIVRILTLRTAVTNWALVFKIEQLCPSLLIWAVFSGSRLTGRGQECPIQDPGNTIHSNKDGHSCSILKTRAQLVTPVQRTGSVFIHFIDFFNKTIDNRWVNKLFQKTLMLSSKIDLDQHLNLKSNNLYFGSHHHHHHASRIFFHMLTSGNFNSFWFN